jgi:hypothetical protein
LNMIDRHRGPRPPHWYKWMVILVLAGSPVGVRAGSVYKCIDAGGAVTFQDRPCAAAANQSVVAPAPAPAWSASPEHSVDRESAARGARRPRRAATPRRSDAPGSSYECRTADGQVFYRHSACPRSVAAIEQRNTAQRASKKAANKSVAVTATRISREEACYELRRAAAAGRLGRNHDQDVSTYDKNLGRDPCR